MLLTYLSRDEFIINNILRTAQQLFRGIQETRLESDIGFLNQLIGAMPKLVLEAIKTEESRERALQTQDRDEENFSPELDQDTLRENLTEISDLDVIAKFNLCFKLSEILGQIAKNYYGSLKQSRKIEIVKECLDIMLRTLSVFFTILRENKDQIVVEIVAILRQHNMTERDDHERIIGFTQSFIFQISAAVSFAFISRISRFVGTKNLAPVFQEILRMNDITSVKLVDKAIKLDHFRGFPIGDLSKLNREISDNLLASTVLRAIVVNHLYMFDVDFKDRQKICQEFQISIADSRIIDHQSREKKTQKK
jgi:hypothetical protein